MFKILRTQKKHAHYISDYNYPVGMDTRPTITFGVADHIFGGRTPYYADHRSLSFRQLLITLFARTGQLLQELSVFITIKKRRTDHDYV